MRAHPILLLAAGLTWTACGDNGIAPPDDSDKSSFPGTLVVSTKTVGNEPDADGYALTVDGGTYGLAPTGAIEIGLPAGPHTLDLLGVANHCSVLRGTPLEVEVGSGSSTSVVFDIDCSLTGARITTTTTGLDLDPDGYLLEVDGTNQAVEVDGTNQAAILVNGVALIALAPGGRILSLIGLAPNCTIDGSATRRVTTVDTVALPVDFAVVCTATTGVIGVVVEAPGSGVEDQYRALVDGAVRARLVPGQRAYVDGVPAGDHIVSLMTPGNCLVGPLPQQVAVKSGGRLRDTVEVTFSVDCTSPSGNLKVTAPTTGPVPDDDYVVEACPDPWCDSPPRRLGALKPNGVLYAALKSPGSYLLSLWHIPATCSVQGPRYVTVTLDPEHPRSHVEFPVACQP